MVNQSISFKVVLPKNKITREGMGKVYLQVIIDRKKKIKYLGLEVEAKYFDSKKQKVHIPKDPRKTLHINSIISKEISRVEHQFYTAKYQDMTITHDWLINDRAQELRFDFVQYYANKIEDDKVKVEKSTVYKWTRTHDLLTEFRKYIPFKTIKLRLVDEFDKFLIKKEFATNTRGHHHRFLRRFIYCAVSDEIIDRNPYERFKIPTAKTFRTFLSSAELSNLIALYQRKTLYAELHKVLRHFLFMTFAGGIRVSDLSRLKHSQIQDRNIVFQPKKTKKTRMLLSVPLCTFALELIHDGRGRNGFIFDTVSDQKMNKHLKNIATHANTRKKVTCHVARHTFATLFLSMGGKIHVLKEILGHSKIETTMIYVHISEDEKQAQISLLDELFEGYPRNTTYILE